MESIFGSKACKLNQRIKGREPAKHGKGEGGLAGALVNFGHHVAHPFEHGGSGGGDSGGGAAVHSIPELEGAAAVNHGVQSLHGGMLSLDGRVQRMEAQLKAQGETLQRVLATLERLAARAG